MKQTRSKISTNINHIYNFVNIYPIVVHFIMIPRCLMYLCLVWLHKSLIYLSQFQQQWYFCYLRKLDNMNCFHNFSWYNQGLTWIYPKLKCFTNLLLFHRQEITQSLWTIQFVTLLSFKLCFAFDLHTPNKISWSR